MHNAHTYVTRCHAMAPVGWYIPVVLGGKKEAPVTYLPTITASRLFSLCNFVSIVLVHTMGCAHHEIWAYAFTFIAHYRI